MKARRLVLGLALVVVLLLAFWPRSQDGIEVVGAQHRVRPAVPAAPVGVPLTAELRTPPDAPRFVALTGNLFPAQSWQPPPARVKPAESLPPPAPVAPGLPYTYFGRWQEANSEVVFLGQDERLLRIKVGEVVDEAWRLDKIEAGGLLFTYLPLNMQKTLRIKR